MSKIEYVCAECEGSDIEMSFSAAANWDVEKQKWELCSACETYVDHCADFHCTSCSYKELPRTPVEVIKKEL